MESIQAVTQLIARSQEYRLPLALLFVDYKKAIDSVEINAVSNALAQAVVDSAYVHLLEQCLSNTSTSIQLFERKLKRAEHDYQNHFETKSEKTGCKGSS
ncbi:hypothetical protein V3C99_018290 [Haemonchus contortus]|uniref:Transcriptional regulator n=1 Tax=Haemonchus contortus TaxID=6289 RepID=A0A7I4Z186_HAECO